MPVSSVWRPDSSFKCESVVPCSWAGCSGAPVRRFCSLLLNVYQFSSPNNYPDLLIHRGGEDSMTAEV